MFDPQSESLLQGAGAHPRMGVPASHSAGGHPASVHAKAMHSPIEPTAWQVNPLLQSLSCVQSVYAAALRAMRETPSAVATASIERTAVG